MLTKLLTKTGSHLSLLVMLLLFLASASQAQDTTLQKKPDSLLTVTPRADSVAKDSTLADTLQKPAKKKAALSSKVEYSSADSLRVEIKGQKVYLFKDATIKYEDIGLKADYVVIDFPKQSVFAEGVPDSTGKKVGIPDFTQGDQEFKSQTIDYNYSTKKGYIQGVLTKQDEGYLHGTIVKKMENNVTYIRNGSFTTCTDEEDPHFEFRFNKAKVIPGKSVITGPAFLEIADVPTPLFIPFGYFPTRKGQRSGIILPAYGESKNQGFFLTNGGYYFAFSNYAALTVVGDIYSHGSWGIKPSLQYNKRYKFNGRIDLGYAYNRVGVEGTNNFTVSKDYKIRWIHTQDKKARPRSNFSANVNIYSRNYNNYNTISNVQTYLSNTFQSSINYATSFGNNVFLNINGSQSQNSQDQSLTITLPEITLTVNQLYPFRPKARIGKAKWYDNIGIRYNFDAKNQYNTFDSLFLQPGWTKEMQNGISNVIPVGGTWRILKYFNFSNAISIYDYMYLSSIRKRYVDPVITPTDTVNGYYETDTVYGFANAFNANLTSSLNTRLYGMFQFKKGPVMAIRHMLTPAVSFSYTPNFGTDFWGYYHYIDNDTATVNPKKYSIFEGSLFGGPPGAKAGIVSFSLSNNLEMKVRNRKDTVTGMKKVMLIDNFVIGTSYDIAKDSMNWAPITLSGRTTLFKNLQIQYNSLWDIYARDSLGRRTGRTEWQVNHRLLRLDNTRWDISLSYSLTSDKVKGKKKPDRGTPQEQQDLMDYYDNYVDFDIPWSFSFNYTFGYQKNYNQAELQRVGKVVQTLGFNGELNITPKWKITLMTGWDFTNHEISFTKIDVYRDLHCWEMRFGWIPKGYQQSWNFSINVKASMLQDMKLNKKKSNLDYY